MPLEATQAEGITDTPLVKVPNVNVLFIELLKQNQTHNSAVGLRLNLSRDI